MPWVWLLVSPFVGVCFFVSHVDLKRSGEFRFCCCGLCIGRMSLSDVGTVDDDVPGNILASWLHNHASSPGVEYAPLSFLQCMLTRKRFSSYSLRIWTFRSPFHTMELIILEISGPVSCVFGTFIPRFLAQVALFWKSHSSLELLYR